MIQAPAEIVWTDHARKRLVERGTDEVEALELIHIGLSQGLFGRSTTSLRNGKVKVMCALGGNRLFVLSVGVQGKAFRKRHNERKRETRKRRRRREEEQD